jgi:hypothetical protein
VQHQISQALKRKERTRVGNKIDVTIRPHCRVPLRCRFSVFNATIRFSVWSIMSLDYEHTRDPDEVLVLIVDDRRLAVHNSRSRALFVIIIILRRCSSVAKFIVCHGYVHNHIHSYAFSPYEHQY